MKQRLKWEELYEGRFVVTHPRDVGLFKIEKPASIDGWLVSEKVKDNWVIKYRLNKEHYINGSYGLWDNEITKELNRDSNLNKLGI